MASLATPWVADGSLIYREDVHEGLENAPEALAGMLGGRNFGKLLVRVGADPDLTGFTPDGGICAVGVDLEICCSSSVMSAGMSANSGVLR